MNSLHGILVLNKPAGITSRDAVDIACDRLNTKEIGHCGTLDPLAKGVLVLVVGRARRLQELLSRSRKVYEARIQLGARSETDDAEGPIECTIPTPQAPSASAVAAAVAQFLGEFEQRPPRYSAVKIQGQRLYELARKGNPIEAPPRKATVYRNELRRYEYPELDLHVESAGGTYVRSIARDLGEVLATGAYLQSLTRTESGGFRLADAVLPEEIEREHVKPLESALSVFPRIDIAASQARRLANGAVLRAELPSLRLDQEDCIFGWVNGRAAALLCRQGPQRVRANRLLVPPEELMQWAEEELALLDADANRQLEEDADTIRTVSS